MWSGGIDSTYALVKLLKDTPHKIHAHHIYIKNYEKREEHEQRAVETLLPKLQEIRPFTFSETMKDYSRLPGTPYDMAVVCFEAGVLFKIFDTDRNLTPFKKWTIGTHEKEGHWQTRWDVIIQGAKAAAWPKDCAEFELQPMVSKLEEMKYLHELNLLKDCWYCRTPTPQGVCGKCKTCEEVLVAIKGN